MNYSGFVADFSFIILLFVIIISTFIFRILITKTKLSNSINKPLGVLSIYLSALCLILCLFSVKMGIFYIQTTGNPTSTVISFYDSIINKDYDTAYALLNNCSSLGLENDLLDNNKLISEALEKSYSYSVSENAIINGLNSTVNVSFSYLDISKLNEDISSHIEPILGNKIATLPKSELYTADGHYQAALMNDIYEEALNMSLKHITDFYVTTDYPVTLEYKKGSWYLNTNEQMLKGFLGEQQEF